jgi:hypothetical protein
MAILAFSALHAFCNACCTCWFHKVFFKKKLSYLLAFAVDIILFIIGLVGLFSTFLAFKDAINTSWLLVLFSMR